MVVSANLSNTKILQLVFTNEKKEYFKATDVDSIYPAVLKEGIEHPDWLKVTFVGRCRMLTGVKVL